MNIFFTLWMHTIFFMKPPDVEVLTEWTLNLFCVILCTNWIQILTPFIYLSAGAIEW